MKERRGLFEAIFGKKPQKTDGYTEYKLLNSYQSNFVPFSGNAWEVNMVRAAVHSFARRAATVQPRHIRRGDGKVLDVESSTYNNILQFKPNPTTTAYKFYYRLAAQYKLYNNAFAYPVWNEATGRTTLPYTPAPVIIPSLTTSRSEGSILRLSSTKRTSGTAIYTEIFKNAALTK